MRKINIVGCSGSGKSYLSLKLHNILNIPVFHMDRLYWHENWVGTPREEFKTIIENVLKNNDSYIIDGTYRNSLEMRFSDSDTIIFLDIDLDTCLKQEEERRGKKRPDLPEFLDEKYDPEFIEYIKSFPSDGRLYILELIEKYKDRNEIIVLHNKDEVNDFLFRVEKNVL